MVAQTVVARPPRSLCSEGTSLMSVEQLIERIQTMNPTATPEYLGGFDREALISYLAHLSYSLEPRGRSARWVRTGDTPAIRIAVPADE